MVPRQEKSAKNKASVGFTLPFLAWIIKAELAEKTKKSRLSPRALWASRPPIKVSQITSNPPLPMPIPDSIAMAVAIAAPDNFVYTFSIFLSCFFVSAQVVIMRIPDHSTSAAKAALIHPILILGRNRLPMIPPIAAGIASSENPLTSSIPRDA